MTRALLVAALAVPALGAAQPVPVGQVWFVEPGAPDDLVHGQWINATECANQATTDVVLRWTGTAMFPAGGSYQIYASNQDVPASSFECAKASNGSTGLVASPVGVPITDQPFQSVTDVPETVQAFLTAAGGTSCDVTGTVTIYVCVQERDSTGATVGCAKGRLILDVAPPAAPTGVAAAAAGDGALQVSWTPPTGDPPAYDYRISASADAAADPNVHTATTDPFTSSYVLAGLVDGVPYDVQVVARSQAGNESAPSAAVTATPIAPGVVPGPRPPGDAGSCGTGGAGPIALLGLTALLARSRSRAARR